MGCASVQVMPNYIYAIIILSAVMHRIIIQRKKYILKHLNFNVNSLTKYGFLCKLQALQNKETLCKIFI
jgi:hypothetical protein